MPGLVPLVPPLPDVDLSDVQGGIFVDYDLEVETHLFFRMSGCVDASCAFVRALEPGVTRACDQDQPADTRLNVGFTWTGLAALGVEDKTLGSFPSEFREGMARRALMLGDNGASAPANWDHPLGSDDIHVWAMVRASGSAPLAGRRAEVFALAGANGLELVYEQPGAGFAPQYAPAKEHFGFNDGIGQPGVEGVGMKVYPGMGTPNEDGGWDPVPVGCFLLGYLNAYDRVEVRPFDDVLRKNSTYMAYRKLEQHVPAFRSFIEQNAHVLAGNKELLAAKMVGRWKSGAPLELCPEKDDPEIGADPEKNNRFLYFDGDRDGQNVPHFAHMRRANPRDHFLGTNPGLINVAAHRILRRSMPYGSWLPEGAHDDGARRGISFRAFNASLMDQFELIQALWISNANETYGLSSDRDPFVGSTEPMGPPSRQLGATFTIPKGDHVATLHDLPRFVTTKGGDYFFVPGISALASLGTRPKKGA